MTWRSLAGPIALLACCGVFAACGSTDEPTESAESTAEATASPAATSNTGEHSSEFFNQEEMDLQLAQRSATPEGPADRGSR